MPARINPCLWFQTAAEAAAEWYVGIFPNSRIEGVARAGDGGPGPAGSAIAVGFALDGVPFTALNGAESAPFTPAISLVVNCKSQAEVDHYWERLGEGGAHLQCGWLTDRFGICWQIVPQRLVELATDADAAKAGRVMAALRQMQKIDIAGLERAAAG